MNRRIWRLAALALPVLLFAADGQASVLAGGMPARMSGVRMVGSLQAGELWLPPMGHPLRISKPFSLPNGPYQAGHRGIDISSDRGQFVVSPVSGTVSFAGVVVDRPVLSIRVDEQIVLSLEPVSSDLRPGDRVTRGQTLGEVVEGHCATPCAHLGVRVDGDYVNPVRFLRPRPRLLPW